MNIEEIKVGETYNVRMKVTYKEKDQVRVKNPMISVYGCDYMILSHKYIHPIHEQPKHGPCRLFKKGDKVRAVEWNGRKPYAHLDDPYRDCPLKMVEGKIFIVRNEGLACTFVTTEDRLSNYDIPTCHLELVTPVEELEPYSVVDAHTHWDVADKNMKTVVTYNKAYHPNAKAAAEAERDHLNAEYRKEHGNG